VLTVASAATMIFEIGVYGFWPSHQSEGIKYFWNSTVLTGKCLMPTEISS